MDPTSPSSPTFRDPDLEAQTSSSGAGGGSRASSFRTADSHRPIPRRGSTESRREHSRSPPQGKDIAHDENSKNDVAGAPGNATQHESGWKPWKPDGPYRTKIPESGTTSTKEDWVKAMEASDDGMCKGWREQIDTLVIFAGLFSATVTAFVVESYQWLDETPADMLARLQLRDRLIAMQDPAKDHLAPATFNVKPAFVAINTLWFASLTIALAAVVISILCKQWLYEYQRYDNFPTDESFLIHGLRYRGLQAWKVPAIIASLPILLQTALVLFLTGVLVLLWSFQTAVASIITAIVGLTFIFLGITTILPAIQYIYPMFDTQCAYKSSQSWSFLFFTFWLYDFSKFTSWATFDRWEVTRVYSGTGHALARAYELLSNSVDAFLSIHSLLVHTSQNPTVKADLLLLSDFTDGLDVETTQPPSRSQRHKQLKSCVVNYYGTSLRLRPTSKSEFSQIVDSDDTNYKYHLQIQDTFSKFLGNDVHIDNPAIFNRYVEHWARCLVDTSQNLEEEGQWRIDDDKWRYIFLCIHDHRAHVQWDPDIAMHLVEIFSHMLKANQLPTDPVFDALTLLYPSLVECHRRHYFNPSPAPLLKEIQEWFSRMPESDLPSKVDNAESILLYLVRGNNLFKESLGSRITALEKQYLTSFAQLLVDFFERDDIKKHVQYSGIVNRSLADLRSYLDHNPPISS